MAIITLNLRCNTKPGEDLFFISDITGLCKCKETGIPMRYSEGNWSVKIETELQGFKYSYAIRREGETISNEASLKRSFYLPGEKYKSIQIYDVYDSSMPSAGFMSTDAFSKSIMRHEAKSISLEGIAVPIVFNTKMPNLTSEKVLSISGSDGLLGRWTEENMVNLQSWEYPEFSLVLDANKMFFPIEYKYLIRDKKTNEILSWENGANRCFSIKADASTDFIIVNDGTPNLPNEDFKGAGVAVPVFSLRTDRGFGVGEFEDIRLLVDWAKQTGQKIIQTLPINDTTTYKTWKDSYPYSGISAYALHPLYIDLEQVGEISDKKTFNEKRAALNNQKFVDYEGVMNEKWAILKEIYEKDKSKTLKSRDFSLFAEKNKKWLNPYSAFCYLRDKHGTSDFSKWEDNAIFNSEKINKMCSPKSKEYRDIMLHQFVQYHLDKQLKSVVEYAHENGIALKGDIPIGINRNSADVWQNPKLFDCNGQAGAPPDYFSMYGQNWGFPIYNWDEMAKDGYQWWTDRLQKMSEYYDAYRIDHILGFFRIFRIPSECTWGLLGQFAPAMPLTQSEIENFGLKFNAELMAKPVINEQAISELFKENAEKAKKLYLKKLKNDLYTLKEEYSTQKKIEAIFDPKGEKTKELSNALSTVACQVLFVEDYKEKGKYHPRISVSMSHRYNMLSNEEKDCINRIYNDFYFCRHEKFWEEEATKKLPVLKSATNMLVCGEDLGMVPECVNSVMSKLEILSLSIQRMPKENWVEFGNLNNVPRMSVCTTSTHDMSTTRAWWEENREQTQRYFNNMLNEYGGAPMFCEPWICKQIIERHLHTKALWVILPIQDWMAINGEIRWNETFSERINDPGNPDNYWRYRMHITLDKLISQTDLSNDIKAMTTYSGRNQ